MLFCKDIDPCCSYCLSGTRISPTEMICLRLGIVNSDGSCGKFSYDPLKREPARPVVLNTSKYSYEDFEL